MIKSFLLAALLTLPLSSFAVGSLDGTAWQLRHMKCQDKGADINPEGLTWQFYFNAGNVFKQTFMVQRPDYMSGRKCTAKSTGIFKVTGDRVVLDLESVDAGHTDCGLGDQDLAPYNWNLKSIDAKTLVLTRVQDGQECANSADTVYSTFDAIAPATTPPPVTPGPPTTTPRAPPVLDDMVQEVDGTPRFLTQNRALEYCAQQRKLLPTIYELTAYAVSRGALVSQTPQKDFYGVEVLQADASTKTFYYNSNAFKPASDQLIWSSSQSNQPSGLVRGYALDLRDGRLLRLTISSIEGGSRIAVQCVR